MTHHQHITPCGQEGATSGCPDKVLATKSRIVNFGQVNDRSDLPLYLAKFTWAWYTRSTQCHSSLVSEERLELPQMGANLGEKGKKFGGQIIRLHLSCGHS